jgi:glycosyltransferase involved in cell wall biosynthesis
MTGPPSGGRVAVALHETELGGATQSLLHVLPLLERRGWSFTLWVPGRGAAEAELRRRGYPVETAERQLRFSVSSLRQPPGVVRRLASVPGYLRRWRTWLAAQDAALLHGNSVLTVPEVSVRPRPGPPAVLYAHETLPDGPKGAVIGRLVRQADAALAVSYAAAGTLRRRGVEATVVHSGVSVPGRSQPGNSTGRVVVGTLGTVCKRKGSELFVAAAQRTRRLGNGIEFRMAGNLVVGGQRPWAEKVVDLAQCSGIQYKPWVDTFAELAEWDIFVLTSRADAFPLAVLEAMAMGLPVVGTRVDGIPEQLDDTGLLVDPEDVAAVADAVLRLAQSPELRASLGAAARRRVERQFTLERQAEGLDCVYRAALARNEGRG